VYNSRAAVVRNNCRPCEVASGTSDGAAKESASCVVCIFWNNVTTL